MQEFIKAFKAAAGDSLEIMWYDSMTEAGEMDWQNALTDKNKGGNCRRRPSAGSR